MNSRDIMEKTFKKSSMSGYKTNEVDSFLSEVAQEMNRMVNENNDLKNKLYIVASKLEEYKKDEQSLKDALFDAQKLSASIVSDAKSKAENLLMDAKFKSENLIKEAQENAEKKISSIKSQIEKEQQALVRVQKEVSNFRAKLLSIYKSHLDLITSMPEIQQNNVANDKPKQEIPQNNISEITSNKSENKENLTRTQQILKEKLAQTQQILREKLDQNQQVDSINKHNNSMIEKNDFKSKFSELKFGNNDVNI